MSNTWTFLTNHAHVLLCIGSNPDLTLREVAQQVGITERAAHRIVSELESEGALLRERQGRRNHYVIQPECPLRHRLECHNTIGALLKLIQAAPEIDGDDTSEDGPAGPQKKS